MSRRERMERELERDIRWHIETETRENIERGMPPEEARFAALRKFGNIAKAKEDTRSVWGWVWLDTLAADIRLALRRTRRAPGTSALAALSMALAFAPSVAMFSVMDALLLTQIPVKAPEEIVDIRFRDTRPNSNRRSEMVSYPEYLEFRDSVQSLTGLVYGSREGAALSLGGRRLLGSATLVSHNYFEVLGIPILHGPGWVKDRAEIVVSHGFWQRELGGAQDVAGKSILFNGHTFTIAGVAPPDFHGAGSGVIQISPDLWAPVEAVLRIRPSFRKVIERRSTRSGTVWGRLRPGVNLERAAADVQIAARRMAEAWPDTNRHLSGHVWAPLEDSNKGGMRLTSIGVILLGILMAVACANITGILLAKAEERRHEIAVRQSLGAPRRRLIREWIVESLVLATAGAALGLAGARLLMNALPALVPEMIIPLYFEFTFGPRVWLYALALVGASALGFGLVPAWRASRPGLLGGLRRDSTVSVLQVRVPLRSLLILGQVAAAEVLLFAAGLMLDVLSGAKALNAGIDPRRPVILALLIAGPEKAARGIDCAALAARLSSIGGVRRVTYGRSVPLAGVVGPRVRLEIPGSETREINGGFAGPDFLSSLGVRMLAGRDLLPSDRHNVVVNAALSRLLNPSGDAVGRMIRLEGRPVEIAGVFEDFAWAYLHDQVTPRVVSVAPLRSAEVTFAVEVAGNPKTFLARIRQEVAAAEPDLTASTFKTLRQHYDVALFGERTATQLLYSIGLLALLLTAAGLHGVAAALFARRAREFALRIALGARSSQVAGLVLRGSLALAAAGVGLGLAIAAPLAQLAAKKLPAISPWSPAAAGLSSAIVVAVAVLTAAVPARRALRLQPSELLRAE